MYYTMRQESWAIIQPMSLYRGPNASIFRDRACCLASTVGATEHNTNTLTPRSICRNHQSFSLHKCPNTRNKSELPPKYKQLLCPKHPSEESRSRLSCWLRGLAILFFFFFWGGWMLWRQICQTFRSTYKRFSSLGPGPVTQTCLAPVSSTWL